MNAPRKNLEALGASAPEIAALQQKAKSAFEAASKQTAALIEETKQAHGGLGAGRPEDRGDACGA